MSAMLHCLLLFQDGCSSGQFHCVVLAQLIEQLQLRMNTSRHGTFRLSVSLCRKETSEQGLLGGCKLLIVAAHLHTLLVEASWMPGEAPRRFEEAFPEPAGARAEPSHVMSSELRGSFRVNFSGKLLMGNFRFSRPTVSHRVSWTSRGMRKVTGKSAKPKTPTPPVERQPAPVRDIEVRRPVPMRIQVICAFDERRLQNRRLMLVCLRMSYCQKQEAVAPMLSLTIPDP